MANYHSILLNANDDLNDDAKQNHVLAHGAGSDILIVSDSHTLNFVSEHPSRSYNSLGFDEPSWV